MRVQQLVLQIAVGVVALSGLSAGATCYQVFKNNETVYRSFDPPVDMGRALSQAVEERFGAGASMSFGPDDGGCPSLDVAPSTGPSMPAWSKIPPGYSSSEIAAENARRQREIEEAAAARRQSETPAINLSDHFNGPEHQSGMASSDGYYGSRYYSRGRRSGSGGLHTGPRGGTYYYTSSGNKRYVSSGGRGGRRK